MPRQAGSVDYYSRAKPAGTMYGVYTLLEKLGFGFYLGGDAFPPKGSPLVIPDSLDEVT